MDQYRNLDIKKVSKQVPHHHNHQQQQQHAQKHVLHPASGSINYFRLIAQSWSAVFKSAIFQLSLLRNLLGIRAFVFAVLPLLYFQLNYILVSKPDRILNKIKAAGGRRPGGGTDQLFGRPTNLPRYYQVLLPATGQAQTEDEPRFE